jgi:hypothetical protein
MRRLSAAGVWAGCVLLLPGCSGGKRAATVSAAAGAAPSAQWRDPGAGDRSVLRVTGIIQAQQALTIRVPHISARESRLTIVRLIPNGSSVQAGDVVVEFDRTQLMDEAIEAEAKVDELGHQLEEKRAQTRSDSANRFGRIKEAEAAMNKALLQLRRGAVISEIDRLKNEERAASARAQVESLRKSDASRRRAEEAAVRVLELKQLRQKLALERLRNNLEKLVVRAPHDGMVAVENIWRSGSMGPPQEGDQMWPGQPVLRVFDPSRMVVVAAVSEPDVVWLSKAARARLYLDAYPGAEFDAELEFASPVATGGVDSPLRTFSARFRVLSQDRRLLPDLSAALELPRGKDASP